jgi:hypothetical protein
LELFVFASEFRDFQGLSAVSRILSDARKKSGALVCKKSIALLIAIYFWTVISDFSSVLQNAIRVLF